MNAATRELFRQNLIAQLAAAGSAGVKPASLKIGARADGFEPTDKQLDDEIDYLVGKKFVEPMGKAISPELKRWKISAAGRDFAAEEGLA